MRNSQYIYAETLGTALLHARSWLDLGCGHQLVPAWIDRQAIGLPLATRMAVGIDLDIDALRRHHNLVLGIAGKIQELPIATASFDLVTANMVVEHVDDPQSLFREVYRILRPGGTFILHTPNLRGYTTLLTRCIPSAWRPRAARLLQGREERDVYPTFYRANTLPVLQTLASRSGLHVADLRTVASSAQLYRVPVLRGLEERLLRALANDRLGDWRPCILGLFVRAAS
jgi:SAM-dependent methyltransferase